MAPTLLDEVSSVGASRRRRWGLTIAFAGAMIAGVVGLRLSVGSAPVAAVAAALLPAAAFAVLLPIALLGQGARALWEPLLAAFLWSSSIGALVGLGLNDAALAAFPAGVVGVLIAPVVEELAKGSALVVIAMVWRGLPRSIREGIACGALAGLGFAVTENLGYYTLAAVQGGAEALTRALYLRGLLEGLNHAVFTAIIGAAAGWGRAARVTGTAAGAIIAAGFLAAAALHSLWNGLASRAITDVLCHAPAIDAPCAPSPNLGDLLVRVPLIVAAFIGPAAALLLILGVRERHNR